MTTPINELEKKLRALHELATKSDFKEDVHEFYQQWADNYDEDHCLESSNYGGPYVTAEALSKVLPDKSALVVDCAAGTGRVGVELAKRGFTRIDAVDFSQKCLDISASKGVYERLLCDVLGRNKLKNVEDGYYSGLTCVGAISIGHLSHDVFPEWTRIVKKGGFMVFTLSWALFPGDPKEHTDTMNEITGAINDLVRRGIWQLVDKVQLESFVLGYGADLYTIRRL